MQTQLPTYRLGALLAIAMTIGFVNQVIAFDGHCSHCGCKKVCRLVCEEKKVSVTCWGCKTEDFCAPGPSKPGCQHCDWVCDDGDPNAPCVQPKKFVWTEWIPGNCAKVYVKHKLMRKTITKTVPSYKWVVCGRCEATCGVATIVPGVNIPPAPIVDAKIIYGRPATLTDGLADRVGH